MTSKLEQLRAMTTVVSDTGDMESIRAFKPTDATTNPSLILKAAEMPAYARLVDEAIVWGRKRGASVGEVTDRIAINFGSELTKIVPGRVSTEVDADLSFDTEGMVAKAKSLIAAYKERGVGHEHILIKLASTWEGVQAARRLQAEGIDCNMTLVFSLAQAIAAGDAKAFLLSPFVGRILDWHVKAGGGPVHARNRSRRAVGPRRSTPITRPTASRRSSWARRSATPARSRLSRAVTGSRSRPSCSRRSRRTRACSRGISTRPIPGRPRPRSRWTKRRFRWMLNEDQMATEKLSDGIRLFAHDLEKLRTMVQHRLAEAA